MPQERILYADTAAWRVERVVKPAGAAHAGNPVYQVATPRWVFPVCGVSEFHVQGRQVLLDGLTVVALPTGLPYQIHEWQAAPRSHMVVSMQPGSTTAGSPESALAWMLAPRALWLLRLHWRALAQGREQATGPVFGQGMLCDSGMAHAAVARARRFMATRTAATDGLRWSLHDVADAAYCSYFHLTRLFQAHAGWGCMPTASSCGWPRRCSAWTRGRATWRPWRMTWATAARATWAPRSAAQSA